MNYSERLRQNGNSGKEEKASEKDCEPMATAASPTTRIFSGIAKNDGREVK